MKTYDDKMEFEANLPAKPSDVFIETCKINLRKIFALPGTGKGWRTRKVAIDPTGDLNTYKLTVDLHKAMGRNFSKESAEEQFESIKTKLIQKLPGWRKLGDNHDGDDDSSLHIPISESLRLQDDWKEYFGHIYERDLQIAEMMRCIEIARDSEMEVRNHVLLYGPPGSGKTEILLSLCEMFGQEVVKRLDATTTTKAGAIQLLLEEDVVAPILAIEELEKVVGENDLPWLLSILDKRAEVMKTNARSGHISRQVKKLVIVTVNNMEKLRSFHEGALIDRFSCPLYCPVPTRELVTKILMDHLEEIPGGKPEWIEPAVEYAYTVENTYQIRRIKGIMAIGGDRLLDGSFQQEHKELLNQRIKDDQEITKYRVL